MARRSTACCVTVKCEQPAVGCRRLGSERMWAQLSLWNINICMLCVPSARPLQRRRGRDRRGREKFPVRMAEKVNQVEFWQAVRPGGGGASIFDFFRCNFSGNVTHFILWSVKLIS